MTAEDGVETLVAEGPIKLDVLKTDGMGNPVVELHWVAPECGCGRKTWLFDYAPEGGFMVTCECGASRRVVFERMSPFPSGRIVGFHERK